MIASLIEPVIKSTPNASNVFIKNYLSFYGKNYALTENIIQQAHTFTKAKIFGDPLQNIGYAKALLHIIFNRWDIL